MTITERAAGLRKRAVALRAAMRPEPVPDDAGGRTVVEQIDVSVGAKVAYEQWATWPHFPSCLDPGGSLVLEDTPGQRLVWRARIGRGHVDGAVAFHKLAPRLTRVVVVLQTHARGPFGRLRSRRRRRGLRDELLAFQRRVMSHRVLHAGN